MVRRYKRTGRRRTRRLRRIRRSSRSYGRRRFRRSRRFIRRRRYGRRRKFYSRKGQKTAIGYLTPKGYKTRTYRYFLTKFMLQDFDGEWRHGTELVDPLFISNPDVSFNILYGKTYTWAEVGSYSDQIKQCTWTGPGNVYSVTDLPSSMSRILGYDCYTIIHLAWYDQMFLQAINFFSNQARLTKFDLHNYSFYRPISVTCKLCPKYPRPPAKFGSIYPKTARMKIRQPPAFTTGVTVPAEGETTVPMPGVDPADSSFEVLSTDVDTDWDTDAENLVGYIIPLAGQGVIGHAGEFAMTAVYASIFASIGRIPTVEFISSFRKAGYSRATLSTNRPTRFVYKFTRNNLHDHLYLRPAPGGELLPENFWSNFYAGGVNAYSPFNNGQYPDNLKNYWINAELGTRTVLRTKRTSGGGVYFDSQELMFHQETPIDASVVFIPGITSEQLWTRYNLQFSYKCAYAGRTYDIS